MKRWSAALLIAALVSVLTGAPVAAAGSDMSFFTVSPCRSVDTRSSTPIQHTVTRSFQMTGVCGIPSTAEAVAATVTVTNQTGGGFLTIWRGDESQPSVSSVQFDFGLIRPAGLTVEVSADSGDVNVFAVVGGGGTLDVIIDVTGYYEAIQVAASDGPYLFEPLTPCRLVDTRSDIGLTDAFASNVTRTFAVGGSCGVPIGARAVTGNLTVTNQTHRGYLKLWPAGSSEPFISTLNFPLGANRANGITVALGTGDGLSARYVVEVAGAPVAGETTDVVLDITGYFIAGGRYSYFPITPCRVFDSRIAAGPAGGPALTAGTARSIIVVGVCGVPAGATAVIGHAITVGPTRRGYVAIRPDGVSASNSTLNVRANEIIGNWFTSALGSNGNLSAIYEADGVNTSTTHLVVDIHGYFLEQQVGT